MGRKSTVGLALSARCLTNIFSTGPALFDRRFNIGQPRPIARIKSESSDRACLALGVTVLTRDLRQRFPPPQIPVGVTHSANDWRDRRQR